MELADVTNDPTQASFASGADNATATVWESDLPAEYNKVEIAIDTMPSRP